MEEKTEQTRGGRGIGDNKNDMECGKCKWKFKPDVRPCGEIKNMSGNWCTIVCLVLIRLLGVMDVKPAE